MNYTNKVGTITKEKNSKFQFIEEVVTIGVTIRIIRKHLLIQIQIEQFKVGKLIILIN